LEEERHSCLQSTTTKLCQLHLREHNPEAAWQDYEEFLNSGGDKMPAATWLDLCRSAETQGQFQRAVGEYEKLASTHAAERQSILALIAAGRLSLGQLNTPADALRFYETAANSPVPHLDWEANISAGIENAKKALSLVSASLGN
jgi:hypothetical protein